MKLNEQIRGLPPWPCIEASKDALSYSVHGKHLSFGRYRFTKWIVRLLTLLYLLVASVVVIARFHTVEALLISWFIQMLFLLMFFRCIPITYWLCWLFNRRTTLVQFTNRAIFIGSTQYDITGNLAVQFVTNRPHILKPYSRHGKLLYTAYECGYRRVEMIYGVARVVPITSLEDDEKAGQFAVALQIAFKFATERQAMAPNPVQKWSKPPPLPE